MFYAILVIIVSIALFLIFRDDHDRSYNKSEKGQPKRLFPQMQEPSRPITEQPKTEKKEEVRKLAEERPQNVVEETDEELDLSFLDKIDYTYDLVENTETFDITGLRYHCSVYDCGKIVGIVKPQPSNIHDSRAQAVIRNDGKLLGYIPRTQLDWYEDFNGQNVPCPFVGEMKLDRRGWLLAEIKVILPSSREYVEEEIENGL